MFPQPLCDTFKILSLRPKLTYNMVDYGYGKENNKMLYVKRDGDLHTAIEYEVTCHLKLETHKDFFHGDSTDIVGSDAQENTVFILAKKYGINSPEEFALRLTQHFLDRYQHVHESHCRIIEYPWERLGAREFKTSSYYERPHNHVFWTTSNEGVRYCDVIRRRGENDPIVMSGIQGLQLLKTTQSSFHGFIKCEYGYEKDQSDRVQSFILSSKWQYKNVNDIDFCKTWNEIRDSFLENFAGDCKKGVLLKSNQQFLHTVGTSVLNRFPQIIAIEAQVPNKQYVKFDSTNYQSLIPGENNEVFISKTDPHSAVHIRLERDGISKL